ncbi:MotE family protein [Lederbergia sp. NSJ-179]|uniref:MotE family protein n=1 Tax=Lederbergia sp. NSJ-179 TaxID=2931402 RepID=UPI001FD206C7|nr:MotE family protein [Lederbergia sp. NSJ-179]MCJ7839642.1 MotE family protein [Lederbergia sp. NSJ-179]
MKKQKTEKERTFFQRFIYWVLIPLLVALFLGLLIASFAGVNVFQQAKELGEKIPFISSVDDQKEKERIAEYKDKMIQLDAEIQNKSAEIEQLKKQIEEKDAEKEHYVLEKQGLEETIEELKEIQAENKRAFKDIVSTYQSMSPKKAAPIILNMKEEEAVKILTHLQTESLAKILENMPPDKAAKYMEKISANAN